MRLIRKSLRKTKVNDSGIHSIAYAQVFLDSYARLLREIRSISISLVMASGRKTKHEDCGDHESGDLALVLYEPISDMRYLQGLELALMLEEMVDKGLNPVLVLDCCHPGGVLRMCLIEMAKPERQSTMQSDRQTSNPDLPKYDSLVYRYLHL